ncbi:MAG: cell division FtsA domain-containing protein [Candidatus Vogelbacteria bacterium]|nr:cell division FtsA domain-containing protein [Candidatus Vogelbacteria bacterium]
MSLILILDLGSTSIGATLGPLDTKASPGTCLTPLATTRLPLSPNAKASPEQFKHEVSQILEEVMQTVLGSIKPVEVFCFLSSIYYVGVPRTIKLQEDKPFAFTPKLIKKLVDEEVTVVKEEFTGRGWTPWLMEVLEREVVHLTANAYPLTEARGEIVNSATINTFIAGADQDLLEIIRQVICRRLNTIPLNIRSFASASFVVMRDLLPQTPSFVMVDISGATTDVLVVSQGALAGIGSFPYGYQNIIKQLADTAQSIPVDIETKLMLLTKDNVPPTLRSLITNTELALNNWRLELEKTSHDILGNLFLPDEIVLIGENDLTRLFARTLKRLPLTALTLSSRAPVVYEVGDRLISQLCQGVPVPGDSFLLLETLFCHKMKSLT